MEISLSQSIPLVIPLRASGGDGESLQWEAALSFLQKAEPTPFGPQPVDLPAQGRYVGTSSPQQTLAAHWSKCLPNIFNKSGSDAAQHVHYIQPRLLHRPWKLHICL